MKDLWIFRLRMQNLFIAKGASASELLKIVTYVAEK